MRIKEVKTCQQRWLKKCHFPQLIAVYSNKKQFVLPWGKIWRQRNTKDKRFVFTHFSTLFPWVAVSRLSHQPCPQLMGLQPTRVTGGLCLAWGHFLVWIWLWWVRVSEHPTEDLGLEGVCAQVGPTTRLVAILCSAQGQAAGQACLRRGEHGEGTPEVNGHLGQPMPRLWPLQCGCRAAGKKSSENWQVI